MIETKLDFTKDHMVHGEEYYEPVKGLSPCRNDVPSHLSDSARMDTHVTFVMDSLYSNDVKVDALRDDKDFHRDLDVLMELYHVDVKVDRSKGSPMVESQVRDLWKIDKLVDGVRDRSVDDFVDTLTPKVMLQMEVQSRANLCKYDTSGVVNLLRTDMFVDGAKVDQEMVALAPLLEVDAMIDQCSKSEEYTSEVKKTSKPLHLMDGTMDGCFKSLLETDKQVDGGEKRSSSELVDPYCHDAQGQDLIGSLFDVADLLRTDVEVDRQSYPKRGARLSPDTKERGVMRSDEVNYAAANMFERTPLSDDDIHDINYVQTNMVHGEEYYEPVKGLSPCRNDVPSHLSDSARMDTHVTFVMDSLYSNDVKVDALRDDKDFHRDLDVLMELYHVDVKVDRSKGSPMVESQVRDLWKIDKLVDGVHDRSVDDFVDTLTPKVMLQMEVQSRANLCKYDTSGVVNLLRTDMFVDGAKIDQEMLALVPLLEVDAMIDQCSKSKECTSEEKKTSKPLHLMDGTMDGCFKSLLMTDKHVDGGEKRSSSELVDPYCHDAQGQDLIGSLFDVADLLRTDVEVDRQSYPKRGARLSPDTKERDKYEEGEDLIVGIFGTFPNNPGSTVEGFSGDTLKHSCPANVTEKTADKKSMQKIGSLLSLFSLSNIPSMFKR